MFFRQILHEDLGCASYVVADGGEAAVVDPKWEIADYLALAVEHGLEIRHVFETHNHADHVSGRGRLVAATGATIRIPARTDVEYAHEPLHDGAAVTLGKTRIRALATPGHRPEHTSYVVEDTSRGHEPWLVLTGDALFVGDVARPDLAVEVEEGARGLFASTRRLLELPEFAEVGPGHFGGSLCGGGGMSEKPFSTLGFERRFNPLLQVEDEDEFVRELTAALRPQPPNFEHILKLNTGPLLRDAAPVEPLTAVRVRELLDGGATLVDGRSPREFDAAHVPRSINVTTVEAAVGTRAAWVLDPDTDVVLLAAGGRDAAVRLGRMLEAVGFRRVRGYLAGGIASWLDADHEARSTTAIDVPALARRLREGDVRLLDVREDDEWRAGHVRGSLHVPYHELRDGIPGEARAAFDGMPLAVACSAGNRSSIAASLLERHGVTDVIHVSDGGIADLAREGIALDQGST